ncbi:MAG: hypothetical protein KDD22_06655 [Bdellovibrionales bacterium]|nr:hypothetical protein [Bdellovibrionales bacterium]
MTRKQFVHALRAAAAVLGTKEVLVIGSQAVHGSMTKAFPAASRSIEVDIALINDIDGRAADLIDGSIGEASIFQDTFGYYAQGVECSTAILPEGWQKRLVPFTSPDAPGVKALCLELHDLWISKAMAGRPKDREFCEQLLSGKYVKVTTLESRLKKVNDQPEEKIELAKSWIHSKKK